MSGLTILYFAWVRERIGRDQDEIAQPEPGTTITTLLDDLSTQSEGHRLAFENRARLRAALDQRFVPLDTAIGVARELAIFPPVTGG